MSSAQFSLRVAAVDGDADTAEQFALDLRAELDDLGRVTVEQIPAGVAPDGTRGLEILGVLAFIITAVQAGEAIGRVMAAVQKVQQRYAKRRQGVRVTVDGVDVEATGDTEALVRRLVRLAGSGPAPAGARDALVIANASYDDAGLSRLRAPAHDADALVRVLGDPAIGGFAVEQLVDADERTIRRRIASFFADRAPDDLLLLHFSCHGIKDARGRLHLAARDTDLAALGATGVPATFVHDVLDETRSRRVVLILDCCYSGAFPRGSLVRSGNDVAVAEEFGGGSGRVVLTASSATEYAFEGTELTTSDGQPSVFTSALVRGLESGEADTDLDGEIGIDELYDYTYRQVRSSTPGQAPMKWSFGVEGSLTVARSVRPAALPAAVTSDVASDRVVLRLEGVRALEGLLAGRSGVRAAAVDALVRVRDNDDSARVRAAAADALDSGAATAAPAERETGGSVPAPRPVVEPVAEPTAPGHAALAEPVAGRAPAVGAGSVGAEPVAAPGRSEPEPVAAAGPEPEPAARAVEPAAAGRSESAPAPTIPRPRGTAEPAQEPAGAPGLLIAAGLLAVASVFVYYLAYHVVGDAVFVESWFTELAHVVELAVAGALLGTRQPRWAALLLGILAWEWVYLSVTLHRQVREALAEEWALMTVAGLAAFAAQACIAVVLWRRRTAWESSARPRAITVAVVAGVLAAAAPLVGVGELMEYYYLEVGEGAVQRTFAGLICAAVIPAAILLRPARRLTAWVATGWLVGGAQYALLLTGHFSVDDREGELGGTAVLWVLVFLTAAVAILLPPRGEPTPPRREPTPPG